MPINPPKNITKWLLYSIYFILLLALSIGITASIRLNQVNENIIQISQDRNIQREVLIDGKYRFLLVDNYANKYLEDYKQGNYILFQQTYADLTAFLETYNGIFSPIPQATLYQQIFTNLSDYQKSLTNIDSSYRADPKNSNGDVTFYTSQLQLHKNETLDSFSSLAQMVESEINEGTNRSLANLNQTRLLLTILIIMMLITGPLFGYAIIRQVNATNLQKQALIDTKNEFEQKLQDQREELNKANQETKQFAYIVSHDLRSSLTNLKGFTKELNYSLDQIKQPLENALPAMETVDHQKVQIALNQDIPEALNYIHNSVNRMESFINAVLKLSRLGRKELVLTEIDLNPIVEEIVANLTYQLELREGGVYAQKLPVITADQTSMEQIFANILDNAIKYWYQGRPLEINITAKEQKDETIFAIKDNGRGIATEDIGSVFALFRRIGQSQEVGEGMGMAYVQAIVRNMGGRIWIDSKLSVGTTVFFTIPKSIPESKGNGY